MEVKDIPGFEGRYAVSVCGKVWSHPKVSRGKMNPLNNKGKWLKQYKGPSGHFRVCLQKKVYAVHRLVALTYIGLPLTDKNTINHIDGNKENNHFSNLEWCNQSYNCAHAWKSGLLKAQNLTQWDQSIASEIQKSYSNGHTVQDLAKKYNIGRSTVYRMLAGQGIYKVETEYVRRGPSRWGKRLAN